MIIDDDFNIRTALSRELRFNHFNIIPAETGIMALNKLEKQYIDTVIVDIRMPVMNGLEFIANVVKSYPHIKIIILSGTITKEVISFIQPYRDNILDVIAKPWDSEKLIELLTVASEIDI